MNNTTQYVWYACYGSNLSAERFGIYITGDLYPQLPYGRLVYVEERDGLPVLTFTCPESWPEAGAERTKPSEAIDFGLVFVLTVFAAIMALNQDNVGILPISLIISAAAAVILTLIKTK